MFELIDITKNREYKKPVKKLYKSAFPFNERVQFFLLWRRAVSGKGVFYAATDDGKFVGLAHVITGDSAVYLFYLAVEESVRGRGYGSKILESVKTNYSGKKVMLNIEELDEEAENYEERLRRKAFYERNGFELAGIKNAARHVRYDMMVYGGAVTFDDYGKLMKDYVGKFIFSTTYKKID